MKEFLKYATPYFLLIISIFLARKTGADPIFFLPAIPLLALYYFLIDNPYRKHRTAVSILFITWIFSLILQGQEITGSWLPNTVVVLLLLIYSLRFFQRPDKLFVDYLKILTVAAFAILNITTPRTGVFVIPILIFVYLLDRLIVRRKVSKTLQIIVFSFMALVCVTFVIYGQIKASEAEKMAEMVMESLQLAENQAAEAAEQAKRQEEILIRLQTELDECNSK